MVCCLGSWALVSSDEGKDFPMREKKSSPDSMARAAWGDKGGNVKLSSQARLC